ncbi:MAG: L,D-transpeptidase [Demequina sp.]|uniref:L,D-transpeptidase n=1 Tax=Demequina sp. TaxID=2050685 RepID=UPI003A8A7294
MRQWRRELSALMFAGLSAVVLTSCAGDTEPEPAPPSDSAVPSVSAPAVSPSPDGEMAIVNPVSEIATAPDGEIDVYDSPGGTVTTTIHAADVLTAPDQTPLVFLVKEREGDWIEVYLPIVPNGSTGWVPADAVEVGSTSFRIEVSLDDFTLTVFQGADVVLTSDVGVGRDDRPTPGGVYYVRELLQPPTDDGPYGPYAYGLSGYQPVLDEFNGGDPIIGIHGTNEPESIGSYVSSGCIRLPNEVITQLVTEVGIPLGTPVTITGSADAGGA